MKKLAIPANTLTVAIGATLIFGYGMVSSFISAVDRASHEEAGVQSTSTVNTHLAHSPTIGQ